MAAIRSLGNWWQWRRSARSLPPQPGPKSAEPRRRAFVTFPESRRSLPAERDDGGACRPECAPGHQPVARTVGVLAPSVR